LSLAPFVVVVVQPFSFGHLGIGRHVAAVTGADRAANIRTRMAIMLATTLATILIIIRNCKGNRYHTLEA
jgi:preprotein translocase subunit SecG